MGALKESKDTFIMAVEERLAQAKKDKVAFSDFLEDKMEQFDYSNTSLAKKVFRRVERQGKVKYIPVTRQTIGSWMRGSMPSTREIYISLGMAFDMSLDEINYILLENYMGYGLYCKNIEDAIWIAVINGLFSLEELEQVKENVEQIFLEEQEDNHRSLSTVDLWVLLAEARTKEQFYQILRDYSEEFRDGAKRFGKCLDEVIEQEYGYYEKAAWFLRDIGCLHCEAQFSKIRAGKAIVTREWLLRFCISLQPSLESIEKLLAKAQMEPLGITPMEIIIEMIARYKSDTVANSQELWMLVESVCQTLQNLGYEIEDTLCKKYNTIYEMSVEQKWWFSLCVGYQLLQSELHDEFGYEKAGYCRHVKVDEVLFEEANRLRKSAEFKQNAAELFKAERTAWNSVKYQTIPSLEITQGFISEALELEKFNDYCYTRKPKHGTQEFVYNDVYLYSTLLYSIWTGNCFQYGQEEQTSKQLRENMERSGVNADELLEALDFNLSLDAVFDEKYNLIHMIKNVYEMR